MNDFTSDKIPFIKLSCPHCGAKRPYWSYHDSYDRYLISYENKTVITDIVSITRIKCSSCKHTHALLPEIIVPYSSHGLLFILAVMREYFSKVKISDICEKYQISVATLYSWKKIFLIHKQLWFGILENIYQDSMLFLYSIPNSGTSQKLSEFFLQTGYSFLQGIIKTAYFSSA